MCHRHKMDASPASLPTGLMAGDAQDALQALGMKYLDTDSVLCQVCPAASASIRVDWGSRIECDRDCGPECRRSNSGTQMVGRWGGGVSGQVFLFWVQPSTSNRQWSPYHRRRFQPSLDTLRSLWVAFQGPSNFVPKY